MAGDWHSEIHETAVSRAFETLGHEVVRFSWHRYFRKPGGIWGGIRRLFRRAQNKYIVGPRVAALNRDLLRTVAASLPDILFIYRGTHITGSSLRTIRSVHPACILIGYNNDDPLGPGQPGWLWRIFLAALPEYDLVLAYRHHNITDFLERGAPRVELLRSWFIPERNRPVQLTGPEKLEFECDVVFVGHYEPDQRVECLEEIAKRGWKLKVFGPGYEWDPVIRSNPFLASQVPVNLVWDEDYNRAISGARIALCFFSKLNRDTYTRRCFEIPAIGTMMLSEYTDDVATLYLEGEEIECFRSTEELVDKIEKYLGDEVMRSKLAKNGARRVRSDGHDVVSRMQQVTEWADDIRETCK